MKIWVSQKRTYVHYSKYLTRLATADLMKMDKDIGLGGKLISRGSDFAIPEVINKDSA